MKLFQIIIDLFEGIYASIVIFWSESSLNNFFNTSRIFNLDNLWLKILKIAIYHLQDSE